ncbi:Dabb family protein [Arenibacter aquaticus]|uniref:Dabb family protein n=1 Tax=Arenibacter aquaticus TaxID=2489054 RepID=A0A3S0BWF8_9FLAO|nr:Dabb family protein [Arenibacter aquaticus]RTE53207.1 Dabb family protein [Arenibacter aquaticus]
MKPVFYSIGLLAAILLMSFNTTNNFNVSQDLRDETPKAQDSVLRHVVLFKFKENTSKEDIAKVEEAFAALPSKIPQIVGYEWGINNSPEGLNKGLTHCFFLTFNSEEDRAIYLPHPDHKAFGAILTPHLEDVTVVDYWTK